MVYGYLFKDITITTQIGNHWSHKKKYIKAYKHILLYFLF